MAKYITASGSVNFDTGRVTHLLIQVNLTLAGTITVADGSGTIAVITNPTVGTRYHYYGLAGTVSINPSGTTDITVSAVPAV